MVKLLIGDNMKKRILVLTIIFISFITGCSMDMKEKAVEMHINKYQKLEKSVVYTGNENVSNKQKEKYLELIKKQYQNMSYKITNIEEDNDNAKAHLEVEIYDYESSINNTEEYYKDNPEKFKTEESFENYKLKELKKVQDRKKVNITLNLYKANDKWYVEDLSNNDLLKITDLG